MDTNEEIKSLLREHIAQSNSFREQMKTDIASIKVHASYTKERIDEHNGIIEKLKESAKESSIAIKVLSAIGLVSIVEFFKHYFFKT